MRIFILTLLLSGCTINRPDRIDNEMYACMDKGNTRTLVYVQNIYSYVECRRLK